MLLYAGVSMPWVREGRLLRHRSKLRRAMIGVGMPGLGTSSDFRNALVGLGPMQAKRILFT
jgi:hypothetical protein